MYWMLEAYLKNKDERQKRYIQEIMSKVPADAHKQESVRKDMAILRASMIAELDAANLYEQFAAETDNEDLKKILMHVANEEKHHIGEFQYMLEKFDPDYSDMLDEGEEEVREELDEED